MTFRDQYANALAVKTDMPVENVPAAAYFAGAFYEQLESCAGRIPTVLCGGGVKIDEALTLSHAPLDCRLLLYTLEGMGTLHIEGQRYPLETGTLLYLNRSRCDFSLLSGLHPWRFITFSFWGGGFFPFLSLWQMWIHSCSHSWKITLPC